MTLLARLIAQEEGFGTSGALPTRDNNPGDLRHAPHAQHPGDPNAIGMEPTVADGWADLERQLQLYAERGLTLEQMVNLYAPDSENNSVAYLTFLCEGLRLPPETSVAEALKLA